MYKRQEAAFRALVERHVRVVQATALRVLAGDAHAAQDVTQAVFTHLARNAAKLPRGVLLGGWLHQHTYFLALNFVRAENRRRARERTAKMCIRDRLGGAWRRKKVKIGRFFCFGRIYRKKRKRTQKRKNTEEYLPRKSAKKGILPPSARRRRRKNYSRKVAKTPRKRKGRRTAFRNSVLISRALREGLTLCKERYFWVELFLKIRHLWSLCGGFFAKLKSAQAD